MAARGADDYPGAKQVDVQHATLAPGDTCPECQAGTVYQKKPAVIVRFVGQAPLQATVYNLQRLRCHLCGKVPHAHDRVCLWTFQNKAILPLLKSERRVVVKWPISMPEAQPAYEWLASRLRKTGTMTNSLPFWCWYFPKRIDLATRARQEKAAIWH